MDNEIKEALRSVMKEELEPIKRRLGAIETKVKEFREEVQTDMRVLKGGQTGIRNEITNRFSEIKTDLRHLSTDIEITYQKASSNEFDLQRLKRQ